jgi:triosephosphate isomerase
MTATPGDAAAVHKVIRAELNALSSSKEVSAAIPILYGGSVTKENAGALLDAQNVDGLLVGGASLDAESWAAIAST